ncbi:MAG: CPBP family glutamic-type intramembrane protease [Pseudomonadota bacterium]
MKEEQIKRCVQMANRDLLLPYGLPYLAYVGIASLGGDWLSPEWNYILKIIIVPAILFWAWKWYVPILGPKKPLGSIAFGIVFGLVGLVVWCLLMAPFVDAAGGKPWSGAGFILRLVSASFIVPVFEEMFIRGYFLRAAFQWDQHRKKMPARAAVNQMLDHDHIEQVQPGAWSVAAILISTLAFTAGHLPSEWLACVAYSILISMLWIVRKDLLSCMVAHGVTNLALAVYVYYTGYWGFW